MKGWVDLGGWLYPDGLPVDGHTYTSINRARRRVTPLIETNALPLSQAATAVKQWWGGEISYFVAKCINISKTVGDTSKVTIYD